MLELIRGDIGSADPFADGPCRVDMPTRAGSMRVYLNGPASGFPVLLLHGFPEIAFSWRHQFRDLGAHGFRVLAPDLPGVGASDFGAEDRMYTSRAITGAVIDVLDALGVNQVQVVGHDWGARHGWALARDYPERVASLFTINGPWHPRSSSPPLSAVLHDRFSFLAFFSAPSTAATLDRDPAATLRFFLGHLYGAVGEEEVRRLHTELPVTDDPSGFASSGSLPPWLSSEELAIYVEAFRRTGFGSSLARYRNMDVDWLEEPVWQPNLRCAALLGTRDPAVLFHLYRPMLEQVSTLELVGLVPQAGHSLPSEKPQLVTSELVAFLSRQRDQAFPEATRSAVPFPQRG